MNIYVVLGILFLHWVFDFVLQSDADAKGKSTSNKHLLNHTGLYSWMWFITICFYVPIANSISANLEHLKWLILFAPITFICHTVTDYYTSRINKLSDNLINNLLAINKIL